MEETGEVAIAVSVWIAIAAWGTALCFRLRSAWTVGFVAYLVHVVCAYAFSYDWSHRIAWDSAARDTAAVVGWETGIGLLVNFAFLAVLAVDLGFQWKTGRRRAAIWIDGFTVFMILNGAVIFGEGAVRWFGGAVLALALVMRLWRRGVDPA